MFSGSRQSSHRLKAALLLPNKGLFKMSKTTTILAGASVVTPNGLLATGCVTLQNDRIAEVQRDVPAALLLSHDDIDIIPLSNDFILTPGLIDIQLNGALGCDFNNATIPQIQSTLSQLPRFGLTSIVPTLITAPLMDMVSSANTLEEVIHISKSNYVRLLGLHLEGPFLNPSRRGTHPQRSMLKPSAETLQLLLSPNVRLMTLSPEVDPDGDLLRYLQQRGVVSLAGHTEANVNQLHRAVEAGLAGVTHLMNAMGGLHHRQPGTATFALTNDELVATFIADGVHIHPEMLRLILRAKGLERLVLVSDAMSLAGLPDGQKTTFAELSVQRQGEMAVNQEGQLAGSVQMLPQMVANLVRWQLCSFEQAITLASTNPARLLGMEKDLGHISQGAKADLVLWDKATLSPIATWIDGQLVWCDPVKLNAAKINLQGQPVNAPSESEFLFPKELNRQQVEEAQPVNLPASGAWTLV
jgi:N-acetylglucosamine-6-phosphate deacetylase